MRRFVVVEVTRWTVACIEDDGTVDALESTVWMTPEAAAEMARQFQEDEERNPDQ